MKYVRALLICLTMATHLPGNQAEKLVDLLETRLKKIRFCPGTQQNSQFHALFVQPSLMLCRQGLYNKSTNNPELFVIRLFIDSVETRRLILGKEINTIYALGYKPGPDDYRTPNFREEVERQEKDCNGITLDYDVTYEAQINELTSSLFLQNLVKDSYE